MPPKKKQEVKSYTVDEKLFVWTTDEGDSVTIPMRLKLGVIRKMSGRDVDADVMFEIIDAVAPGQESVLDEMDVRDFQRMFLAWQTEYNASAGATLGE